MTLHSCVRGIASSAVAIMLLAAVPGSALAQSGGAQKAAAEALFGQAQELLKSGKTAQACSKFDASNKLDPAVGTLLYLGNCYEQQGKTASAWATFAEARSMAEAGKDDRVKIANVRMQALAPQVSKLQLNVAEPIDGLIVRRDGIELPAATWGTPLPLDAGKHTIEATAPGKKSFTRDIDVEDGGRAYSLDIPKLQSDAAAPPPGPASPTPPTPEPGTGPVTTSGGGLTGMQIAGLGVGGAGIASMIVGGIFGGLALGANDDSKELCRTDTLCSEDGLELREDAQDNADVSTATFAIGGALLATGVVLFIVGGADDEAEPSGADSPAISNLRIGGSVSPWFSGATIQGSW